MKPWPSSVTPSEPTEEQFGLNFLHGLWYLVCHQREKEAARETTQRHRWTCLQKCEGELPRPGLGQSYRGESKTRRGPGSLAKRSDGQKFTHKILSSDYIKVTLADGCLVLEAVVF